MIAFITRGVKIALYLVLNIVIKVTLNNLVQIIPLNAPNILGEFRGIVDGKGK